jgi:glycosyltransferase involved in cell wall biosynthesis
VLLVDWLEQQGPWSPGLIDYLESHHQQYDILVFFTYLYAPTVMGMRIAPSKSLLVPTAHDEPALALGIYQDVFGAAAGLVWNTEVERRLVSSRFHLRTVVEDVVGCGVDLPEGEDALMGRPTTAAPDNREPLPPHLEGPANAFRRRHRMHGPFLLYGGRIDPGKGCEELLEYFQAFVKEGSNDLTLMLMGVKLMPLPEDPHVRFAGILPDEERLHAIEAATVVVVPSPYESLSLLALEAFAVGTPVLANARAEVLVDHCRRSNAGLYYADAWEFVEALRLMLKDDRLREALGRNGRTYIQRHYRWSSILTKYERMFNRLRAPVTVRPTGPARSSGAPRAREGRSGAAREQRPPRPAAPTPSGGRSGDRRGERGGSGQRQRPRRRRR